MKTVLYMNNKSKKGPTSVFEDAHTFGKVRYLYQDENLLISIGVEKESISHEDLRRLGGECRKTVRDLKLKEVMIDFSTLVETVEEIDEKEIIELFMFGWYSIDYQFLTYKKKETLDQVDVTFTHKYYEPYAEKAKVKVDALNVARDLCNEPANQLTPEMYAEKLVDLFKGTDVEVEVIPYEQLKEKGFTAIHTVGQGSANKPVLVMLTLNRDSSMKRIGLVGKGITFDTGGTNVKTMNDIGEMKMDMGGSAAVVGAIKLLADTKADVNVVGILPLAENVSSGRAFLPSDVITYRNGLTVEVGNTDAEGRLVLADGILYAQKLGAKTVIDIATLTGTIGQALGLKMAGIFSNEEEDLWSYRELGQLTGDYVWPMPVDDDYKTYIESDTADINNMSSSPFGGAITAALFLKQFVQKNTHWIHVDMANTVRPWKQEGYYGPGASGFGVRLLSELVKNESKK